MLGLKGELNMNFNFKIQAGICCRRRREPVKRFKEISDLVRAVGKEGDFGSSHLIVRGEGEIMHGGQSLQ